MIDFTIQMDIPTTTFQDKTIKTNRKTKKKYIGSSDKVIAIGQEYQYMLKPHRPQETLTGALKVSLYFVFATKVKGKQGKYKDTKPDCDNISKLVLDAMEKVGFYENDSRISDLRIVKKWGEVGSLRVVIEYAENAERRYVNKNRIWEDN